jgi:regulatory protein
MADEAGPGGRHTVGDPARQEQPDPWQIALKHIAVRARTTHEVRQTLTRRGYAPREVAAVIARLTAARYLDDADFARTWVSTRARRGAAAPGRLARELRTRGIAAAEIAAALRALQEDWDPAEAAGEAAKRKLKSLQGLSTPVARRRLAAFLDRRGFTPEIILATCRRYVSDANESE